MTQHIYFFVISPAVESYPLTKKHSLTLSGIPYSGPRSDTETLRIDFAISRLSSMKSTTQFVSEVAIKARAFKQNVI